jgi:hypothetical protein
VLDSDLTVELTDCADCLSEIRTAVRSGRMSKIELGPKRTPIKSYTAILSSSVIFILAPNPAAIASLAESSTWATLARSQSDQQN